MFISSAGSSEAQRRGDSLSALSGFLPSISWDLMDLSHFDLITISISTFKALPAPSSQDVPFNNPDVYSPGSSAPLVAMFPFF